MAMATSEIEQVTTLIERSAKELVVRVNYLESQVNVLNSRVEDVDQNVRNLTVALVVVTAILFATIIISVHSLANAI